MSTQRLEQNGRKRRAMASQAPSTAVMSTGARGAAWKIVGVCSIAAFVVQLDGSALNVALPQIGRSFGVPLAVLQWVVDAYWLFHPCCCSRPAPRAIASGRLGFSTLRISYSPLPTAVSPC